MAFIRIVIILLVGFFAGGLAIMNGHRVPVFLDPFALGIVNPAERSVSVFWIMFWAAVFGMVFGVLLYWSSTADERKKAKTADGTIADLKARIAELEKTNAEDEVLKSVMK